MGSDNPGFAIFLSRADTYYRLKTGLPVYDADGNLVVLSDDDGYDPDIDEDYVEYSDWYNYSEIGTKLACQWGQDAPLNAHCYIDWEEYQGANGLAGCTAVAVGQIMFCCEYAYTYGGLTLS